MAVYGPALAVSDIVQVAFRCQLGDQAGINVRHWKVMALSSTGDNYLNAAGDAVRTGGFPAAYKALIATPATYNGFRIRVLHPTLSLDYPDAGGAGAGSGGAAPLPRQCTGFIRLRSATPGRGKSGRSFIPFPTESQCQPDGKPEDAYVSLLDTLGTLYQSVLSWGTGGYASPVIYARPQPDAVPPLTYGWAYVRTVTSVQAFATQRRRSAFGRVNPDSL